MYSTTPQSCSHEPSSHDPFHPSVGWNEPQLSSRHLPHNADKEKILRFLTGLGSCTFLFDTKIISSVPSCLVVNRCPFKQILRLRSFLFSSTRVGSLHLMHLNIYSTFLKIASGANDSLVIPIVFNHQNLLGVAGNIFHRTLVFYPNPIFPMRSRSPSIFC